MRVKKHRCRESSSSCFCSSSWVSAAIAMLKVFRNAQALLKNIRSEYQHMQGYCLNWEYPSAIWETVILSFGSLLLLYASGSKNCQHVWISIEKGCCMKGKGGLNWFLKAHGSGTKRRSGKVNASETQIFNYPLFLPSEKKWPLKTVVNLWSIESEFVGLQPVASEEIHIKQLSTQWVTYDLKS